MMGGYFSGHPYNKHVAKIDDPQHPVMAAFEGNPFPYADEMYVFGPKGKGKDGKDNQTYSRENVRVLLSIDAEASKIDIKQGGRADGDYAISWVKKQGEGRIFYCSYGHNDTTWYNPVILRHYLDGIQFAFGDLKADATPVPLKK
jgi:type 1 glutamine amidotransferase